MCLLLSWSSGFFALADVTDFRWGKTTNTTTMTNSTAVNASGNISIYGSSVQLNANVTTSGSTKSILFKSTGDILNGAATTTQSNGGPIIFWANSAGGNGSVSIYAGSTINSVNGATTRTASGGGDIIVGGGTGSGPLLLPGSVVISRRRRSASPCLSAPGRATTGRAAWAAECAPAPARRGRTCRSATLP